MKKITKYTSLVLCILALSSCKKNNYFIDQSASILPTYSSFSQIKKNGVFYKTIPVRQVGNLPTNIPISLTALQSVDKNINFNFFSRSAVQGVNYTAANSTTFKAGSYFSSLAILGNPLNYTGDESDTVKIKINSSEIPAIIGRDSMFLIFQRFCDVVPEDFNTTYLSGIVFGTSDKDTLSTGEYNTIDSLTLIPKPTSTSAVGIITDLYPASTGITVDPIRFTMDWTDDGNLNINIDNQYFYTNSAGAVRNIKLSSSYPSTFNSCNKTLSIYVDVFNPVTNASVASGRHIIIAL